MLQLGAKLWGSLRLSDSVVRARGGEVGEEGSSCSPFQGFTINLPKSHSFNSRFTVSMSCHQFFSLISQLLGEVLSLEIPLLERKTLQTFGYCKMDVTDQEFICYRFSFRDCVRFEPLCEHVDSIVRTLRQQEGERCRREEHRQNPPELGRKKEGERVVEEERGPCCQPASPPSSSPLSSSCSPSLPLSLRKLRNPLLLFLLLNQFSSQRTLLLPLLLPRPRLLHHHQSQN